MPGGARRHKKPFEYALDTNWPYAVMEAFRAAQIGQAVARALAEAMKEQQVSANALAAEAEVNRQVIANILAGTTWPDMLTVGCLEVALGVMLWPQHLEWPTDENGVAQQPIPPQGRQGAE
ncbi:helix-turn-helix transcriptional regulator [Streptomyces sp. ZAF1911]|uniref:helix-turn-helix domain-containing protein n=1 Tax=Streptomyces sp. ZAF1911 TaxID=2944129 RepID=UPI00237A7EA4|nr:helix-turn-helix transcriptional regulator [Streptomyces sp. ZAF1911]MDD9376920.1 helix-turn-helix transcriptional regulator [Streptomyces sp. ZAF1911]